MHQPKNRKEIYNLLVLFRLVLISQNSTFIAKKAKTFNEEKNVAEKAPVDGIKIDNLGSDDIKKKDS